MNVRIQITILFMFPLASWAQEGEQQNPGALRASRELTREANQELAGDDFVNAEANYRRAIAKSAENTVAPYNLGTAYYKSESYGEAFGRFKEAGERAAAKPQKHRAFHNMGNVFMKEKEYQKAVEAYKEALRNDPSDEETRYNLALAKEMLKKEKEEQKQDENSEEDQQQDQQEQEQQNQDQNDGEGDQQQDQQQDQQDQGDQEKEENREGDGDRKEEQDRKPDQQQEQQQQPRPNQLSPQQIQNLLQAMENEERKVKEKIDAQKIKGAEVKTEKDW